MEKIKLKVMKKVNENDIKIGKIALNIFNKEMYEISNNQSILKKYWENIDFNKDMLPIFYTAYYKEKITLENMQEANILYIHRFNYFAPSNEYYRKYIGGKDNTMIFVEFKK